MGAQEENEQKADNGGNDKADDELIRRAVGEEGLEKGEDGRRFQHADVRRKAHDGEVHGVEAGVRYDAREDGRNAEARLQRRGDVSRAGAREHRADKAENGVPRDRHGR